jgi:hypothetical protein
MLEDVRESLKWAVAWDETGMAEARRLPGASRCEAFSGLKGDAALGAALAWAPGIQREGKRDG